jgi:hypothetical protein
MDCGLVGRALAGLESGHSNHWTRRRTRSFLATFANSTHGLGQRERTPKIFLNGVLIPGKKARGLVSDLWFAARYVFVSPFVLAVGSQGRPEMWS